MTVVHMPIPYNRLVTKAERRANRAESLAYMEPHIRAWYEEKRQRRKAKKEKKHKRVASSKTPAHLAPYVAYMRAFRKPGKKAAVMKWWNARH